MIESSKKIFSALFLITLTLLLHVHAQVSIFQVSYSIQSKEKALAALSDEYRMMKFEVSRLHSLGYLDKKKQEMDLKLVMPKEVKVVSVPMKEPAAEVALPSSIVQKGFFSFIHLIKEAQAKTSR